MTQFHPKFICFRLDKGTIMDLLQDYKEEKKNLYRYILYLERFYTVCNSNVVPTRGLYQHKINKSEFFLVESMRVELVLSIFRSLRTLDFCPLPFRFSGYAVFCLCFLQHHRKPSLLWFNLFLNIQARTCPKIALLMLRSLSENN